MGDISNRASKLLAAGSSACQSMTVAEMHKAFPGLHVKDESVASILPTENPFHFISFFVNLPVKPPEDDCITLVDRFDSYRVHD